MDERQCAIRCSKEVIKLIPELSIQEMVMRTVDKIYNKRIIIGDGMFTHRFQLFALDGKLISNEMKNLVDNENVERILPIVGVRIEEGEYSACVVLQSELDKIENLPSEMKRFMDAPTLKMGETS